MSFPLEYSTFISIGLLLILSLFTYRGYKRGLVSEVLATMSFIISVVLGIWLSGKFVSKVSIMNFVIQENALKSLELIINKLGDRVILFTIFFILIYIVLFMIRQMMKAINKLQIIGTINHILGAIFGAARAIFLMIIVVLVLASPIFNNGSQVIKAAHLSIVDEMMLSIPLIGDTLKSFHTIERARMNGEFPFTDVLD